MKHIKKTICLRARTDMRDLSITCNKLMYIQHAENNSVPNAKWNFRKQQSIGNGKHPIGQATVLLRLDQLH